jgi:hypothetical protein
MKNRLSLMATTAALVTAIPAHEGVVRAATMYSTGFDNFSTTTTYNDPGNPNASQGGTIDGQDGWDANDNVGSIDEQIVDLGSGNKALRISNTNASGNYGGDQQATHPTPDSIESAGEAGTGVANNVFRYSFDFKPVRDSFQDGLSVRVSPFESGTSFVQGRLYVGEFSGGLGVFWLSYDVSSGFGFTNIATGLDRTAWHSVGVELKFNDGVANDEASISVGNTLVAGLNTFEDFYRDVSPNPIPEINNVIFRSRNSSNEELTGEGIYFDNFSMEVASTTEVPTPASVWLLFSAIAMLLTGHVWRRRSD